MWEPICKNAGLEPHTRVKVEARTSWGARSWWEGLSSTHASINSVLNYYKVIDKDFFCTNSKGSCVWGMPAGSEAVGERDFDSVISVDNGDEAVMALLTWQELETAPHSSAAGQRRRQTHLWGLSTLLRRNLRTPSVSKVHLGWTQDEVISFPPKGWWSWEIWITFLSLTIHFTT